MNDTPGQRLLASLVDVCFFALVGVLAIHRVLTEQAILPILLLYARERFAVAQSKQTMQIVSAAGSGPSNRPPDGGSDGGTGTSGKMPAVPPTPPRDPGTFVKRMAMTLRGYARHPVIVALVLLACLSRI